MITYWGLTFQKWAGGFPGGSGVKKMPAKPGDTGLIPDLGRSHIPWSSYSHAAQLLSLCSRAQEPPLLRPTWPRAPAPQEAPQWEAHWQQLESIPCLPQLEKNLCSNKDPAQPKINKQIKLFLKRNKLQNFLKIGWRVGAMEKIKSA